LIDTTCREWNGIPCFATKSHNETTDAEGESKETRITKAIAYYFYNYINIFH
jgi:hypothetical protein